jgi:hypothetical protein
MKVIHSYANTNNELSKEVAYGQLLSSLLAKKNYGNVHLYTNKALFEIIDKIGIPYTSINTYLLDVSTPTTSIPKIKVFAKQEEPFLHIDLDTFIYDKLDTNKLLSPVTFSHPDFGTRGLGGSFDLMIGGILNKFRKGVIRTENEKHDSLLSFVFDFYIEPYVTLIDSISDSFIDNINFSSIPNMNIIWVNENGLNDFVKSANQALKHYHQNKDYIYNREFGACYIEQFFLHGMMLELNKEYRTLCHNEPDTPKNCYFDKLPFKILEVDTKNHPTKIELFGITTEIKNKFEFKELVKNNFKGFLHATHGLNYDYIQAHIINQIVENFGEEYVLKLHHYFAQNNESISDGERLYMSLFENDLFINYRSLKYCLI